MNAEGAPQHDQDWFLHHFDVETTRFAELLDDADLDARVPPCPEWDVAGLTQHLGMVHRRVTFFIANGRPPSEDEHDRLQNFDRSRAARWYRDCVEELRPSLVAIDPDAPSWNPFPDVEQLGRVWPRRMAHEAVMHRWDLESTLGDPGPIDAELASDGIDEYFGLVIPRLIARDGLVVPTGSFHVHCTDVAGEWLVWEENDEFRMKRAHDKGDAALRGPAEAILLRLWGRTDGLTEPLSPVGDLTVLEGWLAPSGM